MCIVGMVDSVYKRVGGMGRGDCRAWPMRHQRGNLPALGTRERAAILTAIGSESYWHLSRTWATQTGMTTGCLKAQDLVSIRELRMKAHGYA